MPVAASARETKSVKVPSAAQALHVLREGDLRQREADRSFAERSPSALKSAFGQHPLRCEAGEKRRPKNRAGSEAVRGDNFHRLCSGRDMLANSWRARVFGCFVSHIRGIGRCVLYFRIANIMDSLPRFVLDYWPLPWGSLRPRWRPAGGGGGGGGGGAGGGASGRSEVETKPHHGASQTDLTTCDPGQVWDAKKHKCLQRHSGVLPDSDLTEYAFALAKADRNQEAIDVLDLLENPNTPRALNYRGYATRKLGRTDEGIGYYLQSVALDPSYPQVREYLGEAYVIQGKFDLAKDQLSTIERLCGSKECEYYEDLAEALENAHAL
jgi:hypothetical protein